jgi:hypothetical protein
MKNRYMLKLFQELGEGGMKECHGEDKPLLMLPCTPTQHNNNNKKKECVLSMQMKYMHIKCKSRSKQGAFK